ncbi:hypothetical protein HPB52_022884 [Rhipicephalus sanguineus]|uniref:Uncharacterized protein n=1 Tax=Rhipicephalus sanguineus TaxID=34632 RepID=A0A9D4Q3M6_RHISA|nr:hypothetical protein HPB52_022884 [Rhipicephalus sanguineus]
MLVIQRKHIEALHQLQQNDGLNASNKLSPAHVEYHRQSLRLAKFQQPYLERFQGSTATVNLPLPKGAGMELMAMQVATGKPVVQDSWCMSVISLVFVPKSVSYLGQAMFEADLCSYICTSRLNQDPMEMLFQLYKAKRKLE